MASSEVQRANSPDAHRNSLRRECILVVGMHRSGTSAVTRVLSLLGAALPRTMMGPAEGNETGHWEPAVLVALHDRILARCASSWDDCRALDLRSDALKHPETARQIKAQIIDDYGEARFFVIKDPRICRFVPIYKQALSEMAVRPLAVLPFRNPLAVAESLVARTGVRLYSRAYAVLLWLRHVLDAERMTRDIPRAIIEYDDLVDDWTNQIDIIGSRLGIDFSKAALERADEVRDFLTDEQMHHRSTAAALERSRWVDPLVKRAYRQLAILCSDPDNLEARATLDQVHLEFEAELASIASAIYREFDARRVALSQALEAKSSEIDKVNSASTALHDHVHHLNSTVQHLNDTIDRRSAQASELADRLAAMSETACHHQQLSESVGSKLIDLRERHERLLEASAARLEEIEQLKVKIVSNTTRDGNLLEAISTLTIELAASQATVSRLRTDHAAMENRQDALAREAQAAAALQHESAVEISRLNDLTVYQQKQISQLTGELLDAQRRESSLAALQEQTSLRVSRLNDLTVPQQTEISRLASELTKAQDRELTLKGNLERIEQDLREKSALVSALRWTIDHIKSSNSWRLSAPLRWASTAMPSLSKGIKRAGGAIYHAAKGGLPGRVRNRARVGGRSTVEASSLHPVNELAREPLVSLVILNYNKPDLTLRSVAAVLEHTGSSDIQIVVVDNGSDQSSYSTLTQSLPALVDLVRIDVNRYFGEGNNIGAERCTGRYIVFLNNDAFVTAGWLEQLLSVFEAHPDAGAVGPKFIYPDGRLQEVGGTISADGTLVQIGKQGPVERQILEKVRKVQYISAACLMMPRNRFIELGGFDAAYEPAYFEDVDLCMKIRASGQNIYCAPRATVIHIENATSGDEDNREMQLNTIVELNRKKFVSRWGQWITSPAITPKKATPRPISFGQQTKAATAVIYTPYSLLPGGGERYLLQMAGVLAQTHNLTFLTEHHYSAIRLREMIRDFQIEPFQFATQVRRDVVHRFDLSVLLGNESLPPFPGFGHRNLYVCQFPFPIDADTVASRLNHLKSFEAVVVYSEFVRRRLLQLLDAQGVVAPKVHVIAPAVIDTPSLRAKVLPATGAVQVISIGRFFAGGHNKRQDALIEAAIALERDGVPIELHLLGTVHPEPEHRARFQGLLKLAEGHRIIFHPDAPPENVAKSLVEAHFYWHAAGLGVDPSIEPHRCEHFGISVIEGMRAAAVPLVVSNGGPGSIVSDGITGHTYASTEELVQKMKALLSDPSRYARMSAMARAASLEFDQPAFDSQWAALIGGRDAKQSVAELVP